MGLPILNNKYPQTFDIETTAFCNYACLYCDQTILTRKRGNMTVDVFKKIFQDLLTIPVKRIDFDISGEPLLNPATLQMVKIAEDAGVESYFSTNCSLLENFKQQILDSGLSFIVLSFDGMSKETYERYRVGGNFERVFKAITEFMALKNSGGYKKPHVTLSFCVFDWNKHEIDAVKEQAKTWGVDNLLIKRPYVTTRDKKPDLIAVVDGYSRYPIGHITHPCSFVNGRTTILWNGDLTTCSKNLLGDPVIGNVLEKGFKEVWDSANRQAAKRDMIMRKYNICDDCVDGTDMTSGELIRVKDGKVIIVTGKWKKSLKERVVNRVSLMV